MASTVCEYYLLLNYNLLVMVLKIVTRAKEQSKPHYQQPPLNSADPTGMLEMNSRLLKSPLPEPSQF